MMNYGVRWEPFLPQVNDDGTSIHFDEAALRAGTHTNRFVNAPPGLFFDGDPGFPTGTGYAQALLELCSASWLRVGRQRRRPHFGSRVGGNLLRSSDGNLLPEYSRPCRHGPLGPIFKTSIWRIPGQPIPAEIPGWFRPAEMRRKTYRGS